MAQYPNLTNSAGWVMVEVKPSIFIAPAHVALLLDIAKGPPLQIGTDVVLASGHVQFVSGISAKELAKKLHFITEWQHPPGQRPPE